MTKKLLSMLVFTMFIVNMSAQEARTSAPVRQRQILQFNDFLVSLRANANQRSANTDAAHVKSLVKDSQPAAYVLPGGEVKVYGDAPVSLFTDARSLNLIRTRTSALAKDDIEIVTIRINSAAELNAGIDLSVFADFPKVKYIYIQSNANVSADNILRGIRNDNPKYSVFYDLTTIN